MGTSIEGDFRLRIPGFRRYAAELKRLRERARELESIQARLAEAEGAVRALQASRGLASAGEPGGVDENWATRAKRFEYYWGNADKKIDLIATRPFGPVATRILEDGKTFLNADRLYTLWQAVERMPATAQAAVEIGVFKGGSAKLVAEAMLASNRVIPFFACDTFQGHAVVDESIDGRHRVGKQFKSQNASVSTPRVVKYLKKYEFVQVLEGDIRETASAFENQRAFGMVHIDVDVYPITKFCLEFFAPRLVVGGTIVVDDYGFTTCKGVKKAVDDFVSERRGQFWAMHLLTAQAVLTRTG